MSCAVTSSADRTQSLPASLSAFLCGGLGYGRSAIDPEVGPAVLLVTVPEAVRGLGHHMPGEHEILLAIAADAVFGYPACLPLIQDRK